MRTFVPGTLFVTRLLQRFVRPLDVGALRAKLFSQFPANKQPGSTRNGEATEGIEGYAFQANENVATNTTGDATDQT